MKDLPSVCPHAEIQPQWCTFEFYAGLRDPSLGYVAFAMFHDAAQARPPHIGVTEQATPRESVQRFEHKFLLSSRQ
jgi:hypothetical protein